MSLSFFQKLALKKFAKNYIIALPFSLNEAEEVGFSAWFLGTSMKYFLASPYFNPSDNTRYFDALREAVQRSNQLFAEYAQLEEALVVKQNNLIQDAVDEAENDEIISLLMREANELPHFKSAIETKDRIAKAFDLYNKLNISISDA